MHKVFLASTKSLKSKTRPKGVDITFTGAANREATSKGEAPLPRTQDHPLFRTFEQERHQHLTECFLLVRIPLRDSLLILKISTELSTILLQRREKETNIFLQILPTF